MLALGTGHRARWLVTAALVIAAACEPAVGSRPDAITDRNWRLVELGGERAVVPPEERAPYLRLSTEPARLVGYTGCNDLFGSYDLEGDRLRFGEIATTRKACLDPALSRQESSFIEMLGATNRFQSTGDLLVLYRDAQPLARFTTPTEAR